MTRATGRKGLPRPARFWAALAVLAGVALVTAMGAMITVALPGLAGSFGASDADVVWTVTCYQMASMACVLPAASLAGTFGDRIIFLTGLLLYAAGSLLCALSPDLATLTACRALQGVGAAGCTGVSLKLIETIFPSRLLGRGIGLNAATISASIILGPAIASVILSRASWPWLFLATFPAALAAAGLAFAFLPREKPENLTPPAKAGTLKELFPNLLTFGSFFLLVAALSRGAAPPVSAGLAALFLLALVLFVRLERRSPSPSLPVDLLARPVFSLSMTSQLFCFMAQSAVVTACPFFFQERLGFSVVTTGLLLTAWPLGHIVSSLVSGRLTERVSPALVGFLGMSVCTVGIVSFLWLEGGPLDAAWRLSVCGCGYGFFQAPNDQTTLLAAPHYRRSAASAFLALVRSLGQMIGAVAVSSAFHFFPDIPEASYLAAAAFASAGTCSLALRWRFLKKRFTSRVRHRPSAFGSLIRKRRNSSGKQSAPK